MVGNETEYGGHQAGADVCKCHLDADDCLGFVSAKVLRRGVDNTGINRSTAQSNEDKTCQGDFGTQGQKQKKTACQYDALSQTHHLNIVQFQGNKSAECPADGDSNIKPAGKACGGFGRQSVMENQIAACP